MELPASMTMGRTRDEENTPYPPSWIDRLTQGIDALPGPAWCYYLAIILLIVSVQLATAWLEGGFRPDIIPFAFVFTGSSIYYVMMIHYLDKMADDAFVKFRPTMAISEQQAVALRHKLTHLPARTVRILTLMGIVLASLIIVAVQNGLLYVEHGYFGHSLLAQLYWRAALIADQSLFYTLIFHTIHQLRIVNLIYTKHAKIDLFNLSPLYMFSRLTTYSALSIISIAYLWVATYPWLANDFLVMSSWLVGIVAAVAGFGLTFLGIHHRLVEEKHRWKSEAGQWLKMSFVNFHQTIADRKLEDVDAMVKIIEGVNKEQAIVEQIPTWPWQPGTVRGVTTTVIVPVLLWIMFRVLERVITF